MSVGVGGEDSVEGWVGSGGWDCGELSLGGGGGGQCERGGGEGKLCNSKAE